MAVTTYMGRAHRAVLHYSDSVAITELTPYRTYWVGIGRTTPWTVELAPPSPSVAAVALEEPIVYVKAETVSLCKTVNSNPNVTVRGQGYQYVSIGDAISEFARFIYVKTRFDPSETQPYATFRQIAVFSRLVPTSGHLADEWLAPASVEDIGYCEYLENNAPTVMNLNRQEIVQVIIEFK